MSEVKTCELGDLIEFQRGYDLPKSEFRNGPYPVQSSNGILGYHIDYKVEGPGITIGRSGTVGIPHYLNENFYPHNTTLFVKDFKGNDRKYIYYLLKHLKLNDFKTGSGVPTMNRNHLHPLKVNAFIDKNYQVKLSSILSILDQKIALNNQINEELEAMAKTLYDYWFVQFDFPNENGKPYKSSGGKMVYNDQLKREIPEGWGVETLSGLGTIVGGSTPSKSNLDNFVNSGQGISWITPNDLSKNKGNKFISKGEIDISEVGRLSANLKIFPKGTVLLSSRAPIGYLAIASNELTTNQGFKSFIPNKEYDENYIYYVIKQSMKVIEQNASGSTFKEISSTVLGEILVVKPKINLIKKFQEKVVSINNQIYVNEVQNQELTQLRDWLLPMLMNGQVKVE
ncbi:TPA: restriction endonuclease subunit S [Streptococcus suis]|nr:restriction endonuclease subunit S [Streptococcus suis]